MTRWYLKEDGRMHLSVFNKLTESFPLWGSTSQSLKHKATISPSCTVIVNMTLGLKGLVISGSKGARHSRASIFPAEAWKRRESFHSRGQHLWQLSWTKKAFVWEKNWTPTGLVWKTNMTTAYCFGTPKWQFPCLYILLHFLHIFRKAFVLNTANKNLSWYSSTKVNREFKQQRRRRLRNF